MNIRHLHAVAVAARLRHIGRTAAEIHLSQPATSQAIGKIEAELSERLFDRSSQGLTPTPAGELLAARVERGLAELKSAGTAIGGPAAPRLHTTATTAQLRALIGVVEAGSYSLAARRLGLKEPSVHRAAKEFERLCGRELFRASAQGIEPTPLARTLMRGAALAIAEIRQGVAELREWRGLVDGEVHVGCLPLARTQILPDAATRLLARFPDVRLRIADGSYAELLHALRHGKIDCILGALRLPSPAPDIEQEELFSDPLSIVVRPGHLILTESLPGPNRLAALEWVAPREATPARAQFAAFFAAAGVAPPTRVIECSSLVATRGLLVQSDRAGLLSAAQVSYEVKAGLLAVLPTPLPGTSRPIGIATRRFWQPTSAQRYLLETLRHGLAAGNETPPPQRSP